ncbi:MAG: hypothetical protein WC120_04750 [Parcubacteria group bacterium]
MNHWVFWSVQIASLGLLIINLNFMKKILLMLGVGLLGLALPIAGMTITPTRNLILGLAPDEAILALADKIDEEAGKNDEQQQAIENLQQAENERIELEEKKKLQDEEDKIKKEIQAQEEQKKQARISACLQFKNKCESEIRELNSLDVTKKDGLNVIDGFGSRSLEDAKKSLDDNWKHPEYEHDYKIIKEIIEDRKKKLSVVLKGECKDYKNPCE